MFDIRHKQDSHEVRVPEVKSEDSPPEHNFNQDINIYESINSNDLRDRDTNRVPHFAQTPTFTHSRAESKENLVPKAGKADEKK